jgi:SPP1 family predicted phage head-tail adaptor
VALNSDFPGIDPGQFRHQITLLEEVTATDSSGTSVSWQADPVPVVAWMKIEALRSTEVIKAGLDVSQVYLKLTGWYRSQFTANKRIQSPGGNQYVIQAVENVLEMNTYMVLLCLGIGNNN